MVVYIGFEPISHYISRCIFPTKLINQMRCIQVVPSFQHLYLSASNGIRTHTIACYFSPLTEGYSTIELYLHISNAVLSMVYCIFSLALYVVHHIILWQPVNRIRTYTPIANQWCSIQLSYYRIFKYNIGCYHHTLSIWFSVDYK